MLGCQHLYNLSELSQLRAFYQLDLHGYVLVGKLDVLGELLDFLVHGVNFAFELELEVVFLGVEVLVFLALLHLEAVVVLLDVGFALLEGVQYPLVFAYFVI